MADKFWMTVEEAITLREALLKMARMLAYADAGASI